MTSQLHKPDQQAPAGPTLRPERARARARFGGLWRHGDFMRLWAGQTVSQLGSTVTREALPYTAILTLGASPLQMGLLGAAGAAPLLLLGLFAGVLVDRLRRRPLMIAADLGRALLLLSIPAAYLLGALRMGQLYLIAALAGILTVIFNVAYHSFLPALIAREQLVEGNSKLGVSESLAEIGGPPLGGALVQVISGPIALLLDAFSFVVSAVSLARIRMPEPPPAESRRMEGPPADRAHVLRDLTAGLKVIWASPLLRAFASSAIIRNFFGWFFGAIYGLYAIRVLGFSTTTLGLVVACGGVGGLLGAMLAGPLAQRWGAGPTIVGALLIDAAAGGLIWLAGGVLPLAVPLLVASQLIGDGAMTVALIGERSLRQTIAPNRVLGRVNASMNVLSEGIGTLGLLAGGVLAEAIGLRPTAAVAVLGIAASALVVLASPLREYLPLQSADATLPVSLAERSRDERTRL